MATATSEVAATARMAAIEAAPRELLRLREARWLLPSATK